MRATSSSCRIFSLDTGAAEIAAKRKVTVSSERYVADSGDAYDVMDFEVGTSIIEVLAGTYAP